jgi:hypothetical protein
MKKAIQKLRFRWLLPTALLLGGLTATNVQTQAQTLQTQAQQNANWVSASTAIALLEDHIESVHSQLPGLEVGSQPHDNALRRVAFYKGIIRELGTGKKVPDAMEAALSDAATLGGEKEVAFTSKLILRALYDETKVILSN